MTSGVMTIAVRPLTAGASAISIGGDVTSAGEGQLIKAYACASADGASVIVLDFDHLEYMNSGGIGVVVTLLVRARRDGLTLMAVGLSEHYRQILALTRLDEAIGVHASVTEALAAAGF